MVSFGCGATNRHQISDLRSLLGDHDHRVIRRQLERLARRRREPQAQLAAAPHDADRRLAAAPRGILHLRPRRGRRPGALGGQSKGRGGAQVELVAG